MKLPGKLFVTTAAAALAVTAAAPASAAGASARGRVLIWSVLYNPPGPDANASLNSEWVDLRNTSGHPVTITNWTLRDASGHAYTFGTFRLRAHKDVKVHTGSGTDTVTDKHQGSGAWIWNNDGDTATLKDGNGSLKNRCDWSDPGEQYNKVDCAG